MEPESGLGDAARDFLASALAVLRRKNLVATPRSHPFLQVGRDYFGGSLMGLSEFVAFEEAITARLPRFTSKRRALTLQIPEYCQLETQNDGGLE